MLPVIWPVRYCLEIILCVRLQAEKYDNFCVFRIWNVAQSVSIWSTGVMEKRLDYQTYVLPQPCTYIFPSEDLIAWSILFVRNKSIFMQYYIVLRGKFGEKYRSNNKYKFHCITNNMTYYCQVNNKVSRNRARQKYCHVPLLKKIYICILYTYW